MKKSVRIRKGDKGDVALEYERGELVGMRRLASAPVPREDLESLRALDTLEYSRALEREFVRLLGVMLDAAGPAGVPVRSARAECAFRLGISTETVKRYLEKWCFALSAPFEVRDGAIFRKGGGQSEGKNGGGK